VLAERLTAQLLAGRQPKNPAAVAERLLAIQAQDPRGARLAIRARTAGVTAADVDRALDDGVLLVTWLNRGTLHLVRSDDYPWLHALTTPAILTANARRLAQEGVSPAAAERGVVTVERALAEDGPMTRVQLRERLAAARVPTAGQALVHVLMLASLRGLTVRGPMAGREQAYVLVRDWLGPSPRVERDVALRELARRYLAGHGPATDRDLARWAGLPLRDARAGLRAIAPELVECDGYVAVARPLRAIELPPPRLLGAYEPLLLGWIDRTPLLAHAANLVTVNGLFRPFALVDGRAAATWRLDRCRLRLEPFEPLSPAAQAALRTDAVAVASFFDAAP
jgi:hypothetical protein